MLAASIIGSILAGIAAIFSVLAFMRTGRDTLTNGLTLDQLSQALRAESDRIRQAGDENARGLRQELIDNLRGFQETTLKAFRDLGGTLESEVKEFGNHLDLGIKAIDERLIASGAKLDENIGRMGEEASKNRENLRQAIEAKLGDARANQATTAKELREEMTGSFQALGSSVSQTLNQLSEQQKERLTNVTNALGALSERQERAQEALKQTVEGRLDTIRTENSAKLDEMRHTVDEKLQSTLESRLGESFNRVVEQLERVHKGVGEMQILAASVGDLKKVLSNVRARGTFGELQAEMILEQILSPEQFIKNAQVKEGSQERVEFAIRLPGRGTEGELLLPIDAKFPQEDYERLIAATESGDAQAVAAAVDSLENRIRLSAKTIREKYIAPPRTTDFAILYLPTEGLYAEVLRRPGLLEQLQREHHVSITGPTTLTAFLSALQMGFRTLAIEKRSSEVWQILGAVSNEFSRYNEVVDKLSRQLGTAAKSVENLGIRARAMTRKLRDVERLPDSTADIILGPAMADAEDVDELEEPPETSTPAS